MTNGTANGTVTNGTAINIDGGSSSLVNNNEDLGSTSFQFPPEEGEEANGTTTVEVEEEEAQEEVEEENPNTAFQLPPVVNENEENGELVVEENEEAEEGQELIPLNGTAAGIQNLEEENLEEAAEKEYITVAEEVVVKVNTNEDQVNGTIANEEEGNAAEE